MKPTILVLGAGKIGVLIAALLAENHRYTVFLADIAFHGREQEHLKTLKHLHCVSLNAQDEAAMHDFLKANPVHAIVSSLPFFCNIKIAELAKSYGVHYFDLTEDVEVSRAIKQLAEGAAQVFAPQCGLAPGFISIAAHNVMQRFQTIDTVKLRVGALPQYSSHALRYAITWSVDGLINEYANPCYGLVEGTMKELQPLHDLESFELDGILYEAFNTSGGLGTLAETYHGRVHNMTYKTLRYPGHATKMDLLLNHLNLKDDRKTLKHILEHSVPRTYQDVIVLYVSVTGIQNNEFTEVHYVKKFYPRRLQNQDWSAIQITTAGSLCAVLDLVFKNPQQYHGLVRQEEFALQDFEKNHFGEYVLGAANKDQYESIKKAKFSFL